MSEDVTCARVVNARPEAVFAAFIGQGGQEAFYSEPEQVARLRSELQGDIVVYGSRRLSRALMEMGLVDEVRLMVYPVVLGAGDRLFGKTQDKIPLRLVESRPWGDGVVNMIYAPATSDGNGEPRA